jgi:hypothetical protein
MPFSVAIYKLLETIDPQLREVLLAILEEIERQREESITKKEFNQFVQRTEENFAKVWEAINELAQAQKRTEEELRKLVKEHVKTRTQLGGLSNTVGYILENEAFKAVPDLLKKEFGLEVTKRLVRKFVPDDQGNLIEVNIIGQATKDREEFIVIGESKSQLSKNKVSEFLRKKLQPLERTFKEKVFPIMVTHMISEPDVEDYARDLGLKRIYYSYEF